MNREALDNLIENYNSHDEILISKMALLIEKYPYFQLPRFFYAKSLKDQNKNDIDMALNQLALYTADRSIIKQIIESKYQHQKKIKSEIKNVETTIKDTNESKIESKLGLPRDNQSQTRKMPIHTGEIKVKKTKKNKTETKKSEPRLKKSSPPSVDIKLNFLDWIQFTQEKQNQTTLSKEAEKAGPLSDKIHIIDRFLKADPKIPPGGKNESSNYSLEEDFYSNELMTETLAKVLVKQKKYKKAISAYKILSLKYPEKNVFFAGKIKEIRKLQQE